MWPKWTSRYAQWLQPVHFIDAGILEPHVGYIGGTIMQLLLGLLLMSQIQHDTEHDHNDDRQCGATDNARLLEHDTITRWQIGAINLLVLAAWSHKS